jgi:hypothetical protein
LNGEENCENHPSHTSIPVGGKCATIAAQMTAEEWSTLQDRLKQTHQRLRRQLETNEYLDVENSIGEAIGLVAHPAYQLGEIRQANRTIRPA